MKKAILFIYLLLSVFMVSAQTTYTGTISGYKENMGFTSGRLIINNVVTGLHDAYLIDIQPDGQFSLSFPLEHSQECWLSFPFFNGPVYFESGKKLVQDFNITDPSMVSSVFKGDAAVINNDINKVRPVLMDYNWDVIYADIYGLTPEQYKAYFLNMEARKLASIDSTGLNPKAHALARRNVKYAIASILVHYNEKQESAYRRKNNMAFTRKPVLKAQKLRDDYYDFLKNIGYNDPSAMASYNYYEFINRLMFMDPVFDEAKVGDIDYAAQIELLKTKDTTDEAIKGTIKVYEEMILHNATKPGALEKARPVVLKRLLKTNLSLELDLMYLQTISQQMDMQKDTLTGGALTEVTSKTHHKFLLADVSALNGRIKQSIRTAATQTGYTNNQVAGTGNFFTKILDKYKGKVVFIDFWATWCAPCMQGIREMAPMKEELAQNSDIVFLYITNQSSPEKSYLTVMPGIKGEHYRLSEDQYNILSQMFQIIGIPHYAIINREGRVVNGNYHWTEPAQVKKELLSLAVAR